MLLKKVLIFFLFAGFCYLFNLLEGLVTSSLSELSNGLKFVIISWPVSIAAMPFYESID